MDAEYITVSWLEPLRRRLTKPQWQNLILLIVAVQLARTGIGRQLALYLMCVIPSRSCYRRLERLLGQATAVTRLLQRAWVRLVLRVFAPGRGRLNLLLDWTWHRDRCRSLWVMLPVGGRAVALAFFLAPPSLGGAGSQRAFEDQAIKQLRQWLPRGRRALLIGDRGLGGRDRVRFLKEQGFQYLVRINGDTQILRGEEWWALSALTPPLGQRRHFEDVAIGKSQPKERLPVNVVAVHQPLLTPKPVLTNKGKPTGKTITDATWYLVTDLPPGTDAVALYRLRMQVEETFRDYKALLGMEQERTKCPWERLPMLLWALMIGQALDLYQSGAAGQPYRSPRIAPEREEMPAPRVPPYRSESATREGLHELVVQLVLGISPFTPLLREVAAKSARMQERPQVRDRRRPTPAPRRRTKAQVKIHAHA
jgi:hypothetical protein